jgi:hypothetical protein
VIKIVKKLVCSVCGSEKDVPKCCDKSMILKGDYLICCCSEDCSYQAIPECCGKKMEYVEN